MHPNLAQSNTNLIIITYLFKLTKIYEKITFICIRGTGNGQPK